MKNESTTEILSNSRYTTRMLAEGILHVRYHANVEINLTDILKMQQSYEGMEIKPRKLLMDLAEYVSMTTEARTYAAKHAPAFDGTAYVILGLPQRLLVQFYNKLVKRKRDAKVFESYDKALAWLKAV